jgi:hypothetical protein
LQDEPEYFINLLVTKIELQAAILDSEQISDTIWALTTLSRSENHDLAIKLGAQSIFNLEIFNSSRQLAKICWGLCFFDAGLALRLADTVDWTKYELTPTCFNQVNTVYKVNNLTAPAIISSGVNSHGFEHPDKLNRFELIVQNLLENFFGIPKESLRIGEIIGGVETDFTFTAKGFKWAIECDGFYFHTTASGRRAGRDFIQDQIFLNNGYLPVHLSSDTFLNSNLTMQERANALHYAMEFSRNSFASFV